MSNIVIDEVYYLDRKIPVKVLKALNRSRTVFKVETPQGSIETVEADRLHIEPNLLDLVLQKN
ncbi:hypothetical protein [Ohtaekwangia koreensis]|uniref:Uncharacterized protein n=1 Tax=Ohtaekwangia koreensis TaxID=688867 RepID=A0A1T5J7N7_9BACT|nr:hypothetical protein [Ohtaekwangia koreensis]SKC47389.1 hypothetical protein SAMN05660236_0843 [Ohtaekwangia koreensis]